MLDEQGREFRTISANTKIIDSKRGIVLLTVTGCLDAATAPSLEATVHNITREGATRLVFDLSGLFYLSSSGIDCFSNALKAVKPRGGDIILTGLQDRVLSVLQMYGFDRAFHREAAAADGLMCFGSSRLATKIRFPMYIRCPSCSTPVMIEESGTTCCPSCRSNIEVDEAGTVKRSAVRIRKESKNQLPSVQVFGQLELAEHLANGGAHHTHCVSIGNPRSLFRKRGPDNTVPFIIRRSFQSILRLQFYDVGEKRHLRFRQFPKRIPRRSDVSRAIRFFRKTRGKASGYTIHCWQGVSRSTAVALGYLYMLTGSETEAKRILQEIRPEAGPHQKLIRWFDEELGTSLSEIAAEMRQERLDRWKAELGML